MWRRNVLVGKLLVVLILLGGAVAHAGSDTFSVNFYAALDGVASYSSVKQHSRRLPLMRSSDGELQFVPF